MYSCPPIHSWLSASKQRVLAICRAPIILDFDISARSEHCPIVVIQNLSTHRASCKHRDARDYAPVEPLRETNDHIDGADHGSRLSPRPHPSPHPRFLHPSRPLSTSPLRMIPRLGIPIWTTPPLISIIRLFFNDPFLVPSLAQRRRRAVRSCQYQWWQSVQLW